MDNESELPKDPNLFGLVDSWYTTNKELTRLKKKERELRDLVVHALFPEPKKGMNKFELADGREVKLVHGLDYKLVDAATPLQWIAKGWLPENLIKVTYTINTRIYEDLLAEAKIGLSEYVEVKPKAPQVKVE